MNKVIPLIFLLWGLSDPTIAEPSERHGISALSYAETQVSSQVRMSRGSIPWNPLRVSEGNPTLNNNTPCPITSPSVISCTSLICYLHILHCFLLVTSISLFDQHFYLSKMTNPGDVSWATAFHGITPWGILTVRLLTWHRQYMYHVIILTTHQKLIVTDNYIRVQMYLL